jgi:hypothetical protein
MLRSSKNPAYEKMTFPIMKSIWQTIDFKREIYSFASRLKSALAPGLLDTEGGFSSHEGASMYIEFALHHYIGDNGDDVLNDARAALGGADYANYMNSERAAIVVNPHNLAPVGVSWTDGNGIQNRFFR